MMKLTEVNAMSAEAFEREFGNVAEHSPWVARCALGARPFKSRGAMVKAFTRAVTTARQETQLALVRAHPDLATRMKLTNESLREQKGAGLDALSQQEFSQFIHFNELYKAKFGFRFIIAVKGATKQQILKSFEERVKNTQETEFAIALAEICHILRFRIEDMVSP